MSIPNSLFSATRKEAIAYASNNTGEIAGIFEFGGITDLDLSNLFAIVANEEFDFDLHEFLPLEDADPAELFELPSRFVDALAKKAESEISGISIQWSRTEELDCDPKDLEPIVASLIAFSKATDRKNLYFTQSH